jgi:hypothetical protein
MRFKFSGNMLRFAHFQDQITIDAHTIEQGVQSLVTEVPSLKPVLLDGQGRVRSIHRFFFNGELVGRDALGTPAGAQDEISILTAIAGG